jgi:two-component system cell cycle response regulator DivK
MEITATYRWDKKQILVVEDDESSAYLLGVILKDTGARVEYASNGEGAIAYMREHPDTDLILMDVQLPEMDGLTATREIKSFADRVVVIAQTAYIFSTDPHQAQEAGCDDFLTKPLNPSVLLEKMNHFLT